MCRKLKDETPSWWKCKLKHADPLLTESLNLFLHKHKFCLLGGDMLVEGALFYSSFADNSTHNPP